jgi:hypothetical protein
MHDFTGEVQNNLRGGVHLPPRPKRISILLLYIPIVKENETRKLHNFRFITKQSYYSLLNKIFINCSDRAVARRQSNFNVIHFHPIRCNTALVNSTFNVDMACTWLLTRDCMPLSPFLICMLCNIYLYSKLGCFVGLFFLGGGYYY